MNDKLEMSESRHKKSSKFCSYMSLDNNNVTHKCNVQLCKMSGRNQNLDFTM